MIPTGTNRPEPTHQNVQILSDVAQRLKWWLLASSTSCAASTSCSASTSSAVSAPPAAFHHFTMLRRQTRRRRQTRLSWQMKQSGLSRQAVLSQLKALGPSDPGGRASSAPVCRAPMPLPGTPTAAPPVHTCASSAHAGSKARRSAQHDAACPRRAAARRPLQF
jgi:hypothetical protein